MAITQQLVILRMDDLAPYAEARVLVQTARDLVAAARSKEARRLLGDIQVAAVAVAAVVAEALRAGEVREEIRRLREAALGVAELRAAAWAAFDGGALQVSRFDMLMATSARCRREVGVLETAARRQAREQIDRMC